VLLWVLMLLELLRVLCLRALGLLRVLDERLRALELLWVLDERLRALGLLRVLDECLRMCGRCK